MVGPYLDGAERDRGSPRVRRNPDRAWVDLALCRDRSGSNPACRLLLPLAGVTDGTHGTPLSG